MCGYHDAQSKSIGKGFDAGRLDRDEALMELGTIREEMDHCAGCK